QSSAVRTAQQRMTGNQVEPPLGDDLSACSGGRHRSTHCQTYLAPRRSAVTAVTEPADLAACRLHIAQKTSPIGNPSDDNARGRVHWRAASRQWSGGWRRLEIGGRM